MAQTSSCNTTPHTAGKLMFEDFCNVCECVKNSKQNKLKVSKLQKYIEFIRGIGSKERKEMSDNIFSILRLLLPKEERERAAYGIKENTLAKMYIRVLNLPKNGHEANKMLNYKAPTSASAYCSDFADVAYFILKSRSVNTSTLTIEDVNIRLDKMAMYHAENKPRDVDDELMKFVTSMSAFQQKWLIRIILKDMKLGVGQQKILSLFHPDAPDLFDACNNLAKVCSTLYSPQIKLNEIEIDMFSAFRPMLSEKLDITKINSVIKGDVEIFIETKFDGERFQIHMKDNKFKYFSRNGFDYTDNYGSCFESDGLLTKYLKDVLDLSVHSFILDGEMMGWHKEKKIYGSKGMTFDVKKMNEKSTYRPCFCAFDIIQHNGITLTNIPLKKRLKYLDELFRDKEGVIQHSVRAVTTSSEQVLEALNKAIDDQDEGIVIKYCTSPYKPNSRKSGWFKIKPEYTEEAMNELDLLIIGGYYSENKRHGLVCSVMLGLAVPPESDGQDPSIFHSVGRVKLSLRAEDLEELCRKLQSHWRPLDKSNNPSTLLWTKDKPDVWIEPCNSFIVQIKASELVRSNAFKSEYTLRFPRVVKIRYDKPWYGCMTTLEFSELTNNATNVEKLTARRIQSDELEEAGLSTSPRKRQKTGDVAPQFRRANLEGVDEVSSLYFGKEICVITGNNEFSKADIEIKIAENGGKVVQNPGTSTFCIVAGTINARVNNIIKNSSYNVVTADWLLKSLDTKYVRRGVLPKWTPKDLLGITNEMAEEFALKYDEFGDSYTEPANKQSLEYCMTNMSTAVENINLLPLEMQDLDKELFPSGYNPYSFMRMCYLYIVDDFTSMLDHQIEKIKNKLEILVIELQFFGAIYCEELILNGLLTHVVVPSFVDGKKLKEINKQLKLITSKPIIVSLEWLEDCLSQRKLLKEDNYIVVF